MRDGLRLVRRRQQAVSLVLKSVARSTFTDANRERPFAFFEDLFGGTRSRGNHCDRTTGVTSDQIVQVADGEKTLTLCRVGYRNQETGKCFEFRINHMTLPARTIADIHKKRWQVEIFFRFIKQNLKIKSFLGNSKNAILSQVYMALIAYLLLAYLRFMSKIELSLHYLTRLVQLNLFWQGENLNLVDPRTERLKLNYFWQLLLRTYPERNANQ